MRKIAGWTIEELGNCISVSKMTISNLENHKTTMNFTQYIAIRSVIDCEINANPNNKTLATATTILLDQNQPLDNDKYERIQSTINQVAAVAVGATKGEELDDTFTKLVTPLLMEESTFLLPNTGITTTVVGSITVFFLATKNIEPRTTLPKVVSNFPIYFITTLKTTIGIQQNVDIICGRVFKIA